MALLRIFWQLLLCCQTILEAFRGRCLIAYGCQTVVSQPLLVFATTYVILAITRLSGFIVCLTFCSATLFLFACFSASGASHAAGAFFQTLPDVTWKRTAAAVAASILGNTLIATGLMVQKLAHRADEPQAVRDQRPYFLTPRCRKGTNGVSTNGVTAIFMFCWQRDFLGTPVNLLWSPQKCQGVPFCSPQSVKMCYFYSSTISVDPICPQPRGVAIHGGAKVGYDTI